MRVLIVSDTHKHTNVLEKVLAKIGKIDLMIHLGDVINQEEYIRSLAACPVEMVAGNNDYFSNLPQEKEIRIKQYRVLLTHGHYYYVNTGTQFILREAEARGYDIVMFGHTHMPVIEKRNHTYAINPGSIALPRQKGRQPTFIVMNVDENGKLQFELHYYDMFTGEF
ncbi:MAG: metallophosphoesterase family protein [Lachnospiraceae bacterium]